MVVLSRIILFHWGKRHAITVRTYAIWIVLEIFFMSLFYTIYTLVLNPEREYMEVFNDSAVNTSLVLLLPYSVLHLYFSYKEKERQLRLLEENQTEAAVRQSVFSFYDEKNELRLSVKRSNLLVPDLFFLAGYFNSILFSFAYCEGLMLNCLEKARLK